MKSLIVGQKELVMDLVYLIVCVAFFGLFTGYVYLADRRAA